ncbi:hypothetical protein LMB88_02830, partial [Limosilactobacillus reuteri]|nr:hypothetical protein [Limosilactobacillus reuteri]
FGSLNMIPDVTPNGVFYLPPTGWLTSFYNLPLYLYFGNFIRQLSDPSNIVACITCGVTVTLLLLLVYYLRIKK